MSFNVFNLREAADNPFNFCVRLIKISYLYLFPVVSAGFFCLYFMARIQFPHKSYALTASFFCVRQSSSLWQVPFGQGLSPFSSHRTDGLFLRKMSVFRSPCSSHCFRFPHSPYLLRPFSLRPQTVSCASSGSAPNGALHWTHWMTVSQWTISLDQYVVDLPSRSISLRVIFLVWLLLCLRCFRSVRFAFCTSRNFVRGRWIPSLLLNSHIIAGYLVADVAVQLFHQFRAAESRVHLQEHQGHFPFRSEERLASQRRSHAFPNQPEVICYLAEATSLSCPIRSFESWIVELVKIELRQRNVWRYFRKISYFWHAD